MSVFPRHPLSEAALRVLHHVVEPSGSDSPTRLTQKRTRLGPYDHYNVTLQSAFLRTVTVAEAYVDALFIDLVRVGIPDSNALVEAMMADLEISNSRSWNERKDGFKGKLGISLTQCNGWQRLQAAIDVRNGIAHGLGHLTAQQRQKASLPRNVQQQLGVEVRETQFRLSLDALHRCKLGVREFIKGVDAQLSI